MQSNVGIFLMHVYITEEEMTALDGLPWLSFCLYVKAIKPRMDYQTHRVGEYPRISWTALAEWLYVEPHPGVKGGSPSRDQLRRAINWLVKAGIIEVRSLGRQLIFECLLAKQGNSVQNKAAINPRKKPPETDTSEVIDSQELSTGLDRKSRQVKTGKAATHLNTYTLPVLYPDALNDFATQIPSSTSEWLTIFQQQYGFSEQSLNSIKLIAMFETWCDNKISLEKLEQIKSIADKNLGRQPDNPLYYRKFVSEWLRCQEDYKVKDFPISQIKGESRRQNGSRKQKTAAEGMWESCRGGLEGTDFDF